MTVIVNNGWLWLTDGTDYLKLRCREVTADLIMKPTFIHAPGVNFSMDVGTWYWVFKASGVIFNSYTDYTNTLAYLQDWQASAAFTLSVLRNTSENAMAFDGTDTTYTVRLKDGIKGIAKPGNENNTVFEIGALTFEEG